MDDDRLCVQAVGARLLLPDVRIAARVYAREQRDPATKLSKSY
jgi:hypothetical protein